MIGIKNWLLVILNIINGISGYFYSFIKIDMSINDVNFTVDVENNKGQKEIEVNEVETYVISCKDSRFSSKPVMIEVM